MTGKAARSSAVETRRRGDRNVFCPRDTGTSLAQPPDEIDVLVFFEIGESSDAPVHIRADTEVGPVDVTVSTIWMCVVHTFVSFANGVWMAFPIRDAYGSRDDVRSTRILQLARNPGGADHRICIGGGEPRRSSQLSAELGKARRSRTSDVLVLDAEYLTPSGITPAGSRPNSCRGRQPVGRGQRKPTPLLRVREGNWGGLRLRCGRELRQEPGRLAQ